MSVSERLTQVGAGFNESRPYKVLACRGPVRKRTIEHAKSGGDAERHESALGEFVASPLIISGQLDVLPTERREVLERFGINW